MEHETRPCTTDPFSGAPALRLHALNGLELRAALSLALSLTGPKHERESETFYKVTGNSGCDSNPYASGSRAHGRIRGN